MDSHDAGKVFHAPIGLVLSEHDGLQPDLLYISLQRGHIIGEKAIEGAPDLVVEVLSPSTRGRDKGIKRKLYEAARVPHYWLLDPRAKSLEPLRLAARGYESLGVFRPEETFEPELFPGLKIQIGRLWE